MGQIPPKSMYSGGQIAAFQRFLLRRRAELDALRLFFLFAARATESRTSGLPVTQHLAAIIMLFDWLVTSQILPGNPIRRCIRRRHGKGGKVNEIPCHHRIEEYLEEYLQADASAAIPK